jgi:hypothetical protein
MDPTRLAELKEKLLKDKDLAPVWAYFLDHFGENPEFAGLGTAVQIPFLQSVLVQISKQLFPTNATITNIRMVHIPEAQLIHGGFFMGGRVGGLFFFEDAQAGLAVICEQPPSIEVKYARFFGRPHRPIPQPSLN